MRNQIVEVSCTPDALEHFLEVTGSAFEASHTTNLRTILMLDEYPDNTSIMMYDQTHAEASRVHEALLSWMEERAMTVWAAHTLAEVLQLIKCVSTTFLIPGISSLDIRLSQMFWEGQTSKEAAFNIVAAVLGKGGRA